MTVFLNKLPQYSQANANHVVYGFVANVVFALLALGFITDVKQAWLVGLWTVFGVTLVKKVYDYFTEHETIEVCFIKLIDTLTIPVIVGVMQSRNLI